MHSIRLNQDIDKGLSTEQEKFNNADGQIKTSQKRLTLIEKRLPDITNELEKMKSKPGYSGFRT